MSAVKRWKRRGRLLLLGASALLLAGVGTSGYLLNSAGASPGGSAGSGGNGSIATAGASGGPAKASAPPQPTITSEPANLTQDTTATFTYSDSLPPSTFQCSLDGSGYSACGGGLKPHDTGSVTYTGLLPGNHCFYVKAVLAVLSSTPASYCWQQNGKPFTISWTVPAAFYPGTSQAADVTIANPNPKAITIPKSADPGGLTISLATGDPTHCPASDFGVTQGLLVAVTIPANTTETIGAAGVPSADWPVVTMFDGTGGATSHNNQDGCQGVSVTLTFGATASGI